MADRKALMPTKTCRNGMMMERLRLHNKENSSQQRCIMPQLVQKA